MLPFPRSILVLCLLLTVMGMALGQTPATPPPPLQLLSVTSTKERYGSR